MKTVTTVTLDGGENDHSIAWLAHPTRKLLLLVGLALLSLSAVGCGGGGGGAEDFMKMLSEDAKFVTYMNASEISDDSDLRPLRRAIEDRWYFDPYDLDFRDLDYVGVSSEDGALILLGGIGDTNALKDDLSDLDYDDDEIRGVEVWIDSSAKWQAFAFLPGGDVLIAHHESDMEDVLRRRDRDGASLYDEAGGLWSSLPSGIVQFLRTDCGYDDCDFSGFSAEKENADDFTFEWTNEFESESDAERASDDFEDEIDDQMGDFCADFNLVENGVRVSVEVTCDLDESLDFLRNLLSEIT